jgi:hypothetical protein
MVPGPLREVIDARVDAALRHVAAVQTAVPSELELEDVVWGGEPTSTAGRITIKGDGEMFLEARPPSWKAVTKKLIDWQPSVFIANVRGRGPLVIESGYSSAELVMDGTLELARLRGFSWSVFARGSTEPKLWTADILFPADQAPRTFWFPRGNMVVRTEHNSTWGWRFATPEGQVFLLPFDDDRKTWRIAFEVTAGGAPPSDERVVRALALLGFVFGVPMHIGVLQAVSDAGFHGGLAHLGLADHRPRKQVWNGEAVDRTDVLWLVDFVDLSFHYMARFPDAPFLVALHLFNAAHEGFVDTQFLQTFIAAETLATWAIENNQLHSAGDNRIADKAAWKQWVASNAQAIRARAVSGKEDSLVDRVLSSEISSGSPIQKVFKGERLAWTGEMADAERCRNMVAHQGVLGRHAWRARNWTRDLERVQFARLIFTATMAMLVRYHGPLADRGIDEHKRKWWWTSDPAPSEIIHVSYNPSERNERL